MMVMMLLMVLTIRRDQKEEEQLSDDTQRLSVMVAQVLSFSVLAQSVFAADRETRVGLLVSMA